MAGEDEGEERKRRWRGRLILGLRRAGRYAGRGGAESGGHVAAGVRVELQCAGLYPYHLACATSR